MPKQLAFSFLIEEHIRQAHQAIWDGVMLIVALALLNDDHPDHARLVKGRTADVNAVMECTEELYLKLHKMCEELYGYKEPWRFLISERGERTCGFSTVTNG